VSSANARAKNNSALLFMNTVYVYKNCYKLEINGMINKYSQHANIKHLGFGDSLVELTEPKPKKKKEIVSRKKLALFRRISK
jgi:hypothetical protein